MNVLLFVDGGEVPEKPLYSIAYLPPFFKGKIHKDTGETVNNSGNAALLRPPRGSPRTRPAGPRRRRAARRFPDPAGKSVPRAYPPPERKRLLGNMRQNPPIPRGIFYIRVCLLFLRQTCIIKIVFSFFNGLHAIRVSFHNPMISLHGGPL